MSNREEMSTKMTGDHEEVVEEKEKKKYDEEKNLVKLLGGRSFVRTLTADYV